MRAKRTRIDDATFALNLAPMLDVIVSITPMLLLSIAFVQVSIIEAPLPQAVANAITAEKKDKDVRIELEVSKTKGLKYTVHDGAKKQVKEIPLKDGKFDLERLKAETVAIKFVHPDVFHLDLMPDGKAQLNELVNIMDTVRKVGPKERKFTFTDPKTGKKEETDMMFPDTVFANVMGK